MRRKVKAGLAVPAPSGAPRGTRYHRRMRIERVRRVVCVAGGVALAGVLSACSGDGSGDRRLMGYDVQGRAVYADARTKAELDRRDQAIKIAQDVQTGKKRLDQLKPEERLLLSEIMPEPRRDEE